MSYTPIPSYTGNTPNRATDSPSEFADNADDWLSYQNGIEDNYNQLASDVNDMAGAAETSEANAALSEDAAQTAASAAEATANYKGLWSDLTGALSIPASVFHNDYNWQLLTSLADVTASEPGVTTDWEIIRTDQVTSISALRNRGTETGHSVYLSDGQASGRHDWDNSDLSEEAALIFSYLGDYRFIVPPAGEDGSNGAWVYRANKGIVTLEMFGAEVGTDVTDQFDACLNFILRSNTDSDKYSLDLLSGEYDYSGLGVDAGGSGKSKTPKITGQGKRESIINITSDTYLFRFEQIESCNFSGFDVVGGKGFCVETTSSAAVFNTKSFTDMRIIDHTECGIGSNSSDSPNWKIDKVDFSPSTNTTLNVALSGLCDESEITDCTMPEGILKLAWGGNNAKINKNFFGAPQSSTDCNIWLTPRGQAVNSGAGLVISKNKFGNELSGNTTDLTRRILVCEESGSGAFYENQTPTFSDSASDQYCTLPTIADNLFNGWTDTECCVLEVYCEIPRGLNFKRDNRFESNLPSQIVRVSETLTLNNDTDSFGNVICIPFLRNVSSTLAAQNRGFAQVYDKYRVGQQSNKEVRSDGSSSGINILAEYTDSALDNSASVSHTNATVTSVTGELTADDTAKQIQFTSSSGQTEIKIPVTELDYTRPVRVAISCKTSNLDKIAVNFDRRESGTTLKNLVYKEAELSDDWVVVTFIASLQEDVTDALRIFITPVDYVSTTNDTYILDNIFVYQSENNQTIDHLRAFGSKAALWNGAHIKMGDIEIWYDETNNVMRWKNGQPTSETDGASF